MATAVMKMHEHTGLHLLSSVALSDTYDECYLPIPSRFYSNQNTPVNLLPRSPQQAQRRPPQQQPPPSFAVPTKPTHTTTSPTSLASGIVSNAPNNNTSSSGVSDAEDVLAVQRRVKQRLSLILSRKLNVFRVLSLRDDTKHLISDDICTVRGASNRLIAVKGYYSFLQKRNLQDEAAFSVHSLLPMRKKRPFIKITMPLEVDCEPVRKCSHNKRVSFKAVISECVYFFV